MDKLKKYLITFGVGLLAAFAIAYGRDIFSQTQAHIIFAILADSFVVPGVILAGIGGLMFVSNEGMFDGFAYGITSFLDLFRKEKKNKYHTFYEYKESKKDRDITFGFLLICGLALIAVSAVMLLLYHKYI